ncbi:MAG: hypothetical protein LC650_00565 [Actinobacteria bacterium]|nr:hypothetical protein [Actinomycetota bacterium]
MKSQLTIVFAWLVLLAIVIAFGMAAPEVLLFSATVLLGLWAAVTLMYHYM